MEKPMFITIAEVVVYAFSAVILFAPIIGYHRTAKLLGGVPWGATRQLLRFLWETKHPYRLAGLAAYTAFVIALASIPERFGVFSYPSAFAVAILAMLLGILLRIMQPPVVLFLTSSSPHAARLLIRTNDALAPARAVALLDERQMDFFQRRISLNDNLRTKSPLIWKSIVYQLIELTPVVVIDTRGESHAVKEEAAIIGASRSSCVSRHRTAGVPLSTCTTSTPRIMPCRPLPKTS